MIYIIDLREEQEILQERIVSKNDDYVIIAIPSRYIFANVEFIEKISRDSKVYLLCRSGNRSSSIKNKYFKNIENIISVDGGLKSLERFGDNIEILEGSGGFGMQQYMQIVFVFVMIGLLLAIFMDVKKLYLLIGLVFFIGFIFYQIFSNSCILSKIIPYK